jgi:lipopolysaccharide/colanic/teichoic acid biosynthesis glycosyltransferase
MDANQLVYDHELSQQPRGVVLSALSRRVLDVGLAMVLIVLLVPVVLLIVLTIWVDSPGPVLFRQRRLGRDQVPFTLHKFRTMKIDADPGPHQEYVRALITGDGGGQIPVQNDGQTLFKLAVDDRLTRVGRLLRRTSLDELPQLWNVLRGQMSLVGPRPVIPYEVEHYPDWYRERFAIKPGMTGLWQVSGRNERTYEEMVRFDLEYVRRESLGLYLIVLFRTIWVVFSRQGAV